MLILNFNKPNKLLLMKNRLIALIGLMFIFSTGYSRIDEFKVLETETKGIKIQINPRLELFHIMAYLSNSKYLNNYSFKYKSDIDSFFSSSKNDNSVLFVKKVLQNYNAHLSINALFFDKNFKYDNSFMQFLQLDDFGLTNTIANKVHLMDSLLKAVDSFAKTSHFKIFFKNNQNYYKQKINEVAKEISDMDMIKDFESFWGTKKDNYIIVITILEQDIHASWFTLNNKTNSLFYLSPKFSIDNDAKFGNSNITNLREGKMAAKDYIYYGATHEIGHTFLNPIMDNYTFNIDQIPFKISTSDPSKTIFLCESYLRSLTAYFLIKNQYEEFAQMVLQGEKQQGYIYNDKIIELIMDYSNSRDKYKEFNDYVLILLDKLKGQIE